MEMIVGTAGHIDHGKTALIKALTGIDADRLPEEKQRGITIDLGFAELSLGDLHIGFVDVPGHEKFVKNMLAGASGIDAVLLVIAADEGVMPQTREHFEICRLLGIRTGIIALTKVDLVDDETLQFARLDAAELVEASFLDGAPVIGLSSRSGEGIDDLKAAFERLGSRSRPASKALVTRLPIDRSFSVRGFGAVVTGTLVSGRIVEGDEMELLPVRRRVRVRGIESHGAKITEAAAGRRVAVNLGGIDHADISRGMMLVEPGVLRPTQIVDAEVELLADAARPLRTRQRVRVHIGTVEALARLQVIDKCREIAQGGKGLVQLRLEAPIVAVPGERFILRSYSPQITIAGGTVIDPLAVKYKTSDLPAVRDLLYSLKTTGDNLADRVRLLVEFSGRQGLSMNDLQARTGATSSDLDLAINACVDDNSVIDIDGHLTSRVRFDELRSACITQVTAFHDRDPLARGISREELRVRAAAYWPPDVFRAALASAKGIVADGDIVRLASHSAALSPDESVVRQRISSVYKNSRLAVPRLDDVLTEAANDTKLGRADVRKIFQMLLDAGEIVKVTDEFYFSTAAINGLIEAMQRYAAGTADRLIDVAHFKDIAGVSRKFAIPLLEYFDRTRVTRRSGDKRVIQ